VVVGYTPPPPPGPPDPTYPPGEYGIQVGVVPGVGFPLTYTDTAPLPAPPGQLGQSTTNGVIVCDGAELMTAIGYSGVGVIVGVGVTVFVPHGVQLLVNVGSTVGGKISLAFIDPSGFTTRGIALV
jgi:hypothetical protein